MTWFKAFGWVEAICILLFLFLYALYVSKLLRVGRIFNTPFYIITIKLLLRTVFFSLLIISLLGPLYGGSKKEIKSIGKDIMMCVDLSKSMDAFDVQPTRLEKIKFEMKKIVDAFSSDRVGIIIFSSEAFMQCPLTYDQNALHLFIETMNTNLVPSTGTDFGPPLRMALNKLNDTEKTEPQQKSKVIVLISDGEDFGEDTDPIIQDIEDNQIKLFTLGVGTARGSQIQSSQGYKVDSKGNTVISKLNTSSLKSLANKTDGEYFEINDSRNDVSKLIHTIRKIEGQLRDTRMVDVSANQYYYFLLFAFILLLADTVIPIKTLSI